MKWYESQQTGRLMPLLPACARLDGRNFHAFTKGLRRPYDESLSQLMVDLTRSLIEETGAIIGYTQSDEITLIWYADNTKTQIFCDGRVAKMISLLAAMASVRFLSGVASVFPNKVDEMPVFDCRVWTVPTLQEAANVLLWRERDATKNSISMAARTFFSHKDLLHKTGDEMQEMMFQKGQNWNDYPDSFKRGTYIARRKKIRQFTTTELEKLPPMHEARRNPDLIIERTDIEPLQLPPLDRIANKVQVLFFGEEIENVAPSSRPD